MKPHVSTSVFHPSFLFINSVIDTTESGELIKVKVSNDRRYITVNGLKVVERDVLAANGK